MTKVLRYRVIIIIICLVIIVGCIKAYPTTQAHIDNEYPDVIPSDDGNPDNNKNNGNSGIKNPDNENRITPEPTDDHSNGTGPEETQKPEETQEPEEEQQDIKNEMDDIAILVNKTYELPSDFIPLNLVKPNVLFVSGAANNLLRKEAADALEKLFEGANEAGFELYALSGYRKYENQKEIFNLNVSRYGSVEAANRYSAKPGQSEHQTGLAMDITSARVKFKLTKAFGDTPEGKWVAANAHKYGFIIRYPKEKEHITGYMYEPWHIRFLGVELATKVFNSGLTYEEYLNNTNNDGNG